MSGKRQRKGFTITEVLIALAIVGVLLALAIPGVVALSRRLKLSERDSMARQLFIQAQSQLLLEKSGGTLGSVGGAALANQPTDFPAELTWHIGDYVYLERAAAEELLPAFGIDSTVAHGHYVIEYHKQTGMVYGVFYSDDAFIYSSGMARDQGSRMDTMVGYYGGSGAEESVAEKAPQAILRIVNEDDLYAVITPEAGVEYTLQISDVEGNVEKEYTFTANDMLNVAIRYPNEMTYTEGEYRLYLDRLEGSGFSARFPGLTPGEDVKVTALTELTSGVALPATVSAVDNSLFQMVDGARAFVSWSRHLQNLAPDVSAVDGVVTSAVQVAVITWSGSDDFIPITNSNLTSFDGSGLTLSGFSFGELNGRSGLFGAFTGSAITRVRLVDPAANGAWAGALAGSVSGTEVSDCMAYMVYAIGKSPRDYSVRGDIYAGGLVGYATDATFATCSASMPVVQAVGSSAYAGGLVGSGGDNLTFNQCYAVSGWASSIEGLAFYGGVSAGLGNAGGLVGFAPQGEFQDCYAVGRVTGAYAGGMAGRNESTRYVGCYTAALVEGAIAGYPFSPGNPTGIYCYYLTLPDLEAQEGTGLTACSVDELRTCLKSGVWAKGTVATTKPYRMAGAYPYPRLITLVHHGDWVFAEELQVGDFDGLVYYEYYYDGTYGFYAEGQGDTLSDEKVLVSDGYAFIRATGGDTLEATYYYNAAPNWYNLLPANIMLRRAEDASSLGQQVYLMTSESDVLTRSSAPNADTFFHMLLSGGETYYFQPNFAKTAVNGAADRPDTPGQIEVRTARQLARMGHIYEYMQDLLSGLNYLQSRSIDFATYLPAQMMSPICKVWPYFTGTYDGGNSVITGADIISSGDNVGLFGNVYGTLKNIVFISDLNRDTPREIRGDAFVGGLVGRLQGGGFIENCVVAGFAIIGEDSVGGFVGGLNGGTMKDCAAVNGYFEAGPSGGYVQATAANAMVGGFFGSGGRPVDRCYAVGRIVSTSSNAAGFGYNNYYGALTNSYCAVVNGAGEYLSFSPFGVNANCWAFNGSNDSQLIAALTGSGGWSMITQAGYSFRYESISTEDIYLLPAIYQASGAYTHYGNWPEILEPGAAGFYYYEKYTNGTYGFYMEQGGEVISSLSDNLPVAEDGYAYMVEDNPEMTRTVEYHAGKWNTTKTTVSISSTQIIDTTGESKYVYLLTPGGEVLQRSVSLNADGNLYHRVYMSGTLFFYHPHFAKTVHADLSAAPAAPTYLELRTARQLAQLGAVSDSREKTLFETQSFTQTRDIDFSTYATSLTLTPLLHYNGYKGVFDGGGYDIRNISITNTSTKTGLFAWLKGGTIRNVHISNGVVTGTNEVGALLGQSETGTIVGCSVSNVTVSGTRYVGGLIGDLLHGTVDQCTVAEVRATASGDHCGGMIGRADKAGTMVTNCAVGIGDGGSVTAATGAGGLIGRNGSATVTGCTVYGYVGDFAGTAGTVTATNSAGGFIGVSDTSGIRLTDNTVIGVNVTATGNYAGGFIGSSMRVTMEHCTVYNPSNASVSGPITVRGASYVGGFGGEGETYYTNCAVAGLTIVGDNFVGGFVGRLNGAGSSATACAAANGYFGSQSSVGGTIISSGKNNIGGFAGFAIGTITNSYTVARLNVSGIKKTSAFVGGGSSTLNNCYSISQNSGGEYLDFGNSSKFTNCVAYNGTNGDALRSTFAAIPAFALPTLNTTRPIDPGLASSAYPYPSALRRGGEAWHYGNWAE